jgi:hypothetical protein
MHRRTSWRSTGSRRSLRRRSRVDRPWAGLRRDHSSLSNRLPGNGFYRSRGRWCLGSCCGSGRSSRRLRRNSLRRCCSRGRMCRRSHNNRGRRSRLLRRRWSHHGRRNGLGCRRRDNNAAFCRRCSWFRGNLSRPLRRRRRGLRYRLRRRSGGRRLGGSNRRPGRRRGRLVLLLLFLLEQSQHVAGLGDLGKINLRLDLWRGCPFPRGRTALGGKVLAHPLRFVLLNGA